MLYEFIEPQKGISSISIDVNDDKLIHITSYDKLILTFDLIQVLYQNILQNKRTVRHIVRSNPYNFIYLDVVQYHNLNQVKEN